MTSVHEHYRDHLGPLYGWLIGGFDAAVEAARAELRAVGLESGSGRVAVDLGAGPGPHAIALAEAGYVVTAIDTCDTLLDELRTRAGDLRIRCVNDDVRHFQRHCEGVQDVVVCMGDTLTHLDSHQDVERLFEHVSGALSPRGLFVATFRDYSGAVAHGVDRFVLVRQDGERMLTCGLEYQETRVIVHDLLHEKTETGWTLRVSRYPKLRLDPDWARARLTQLGLVATLSDTPNGLVRLVAGRHS